MTSIVGKKVLQPLLIHIPGDFSRLQALDTLMDHFRSGLALLPREARGLGGRPKDGLGDYYRQLLALKRTLEQDAQGNWTPRWLDNGRADHYAHAEVYCLLADEIRPPRWIVSTHQVGGERCEQTQLAGLGRPRRRHALNRGLRRR